MINLKHLGPALRILRIRSGLMQKQISETTGMSRSQVSRYESCRDIPNLVTLTKYLDAVGAHLGDLHMAMMQTQTDLPCPTAELSVRDLLRPLIAELMREHLDGANGARNHNGAHDNAS